MKKEITLWSFWKSPDLGKKGIQVNSWALKLFRIATEEEYKATLQKIPDYEIQEEDVSIDSIDDMGSMYNIVDSINSH